MFGQRSLGFFLCCTLGLCVFLFVLINRSLTPEEPKSLATKWADCMKKKLYYDDYRTIFLSVAKSSRYCCASLGIAPSSVRPYKNKDEVKYAILPADLSDPTTLVTLGIGNDTVAEARLRMDLPRIVMHGADPIVEGNKWQFEKIGTFHNFAVSRDSGSSIAMVLIDGHYHNKTFNHVSLVDFLKNNVKADFIDYLWMDSEYSEYDMLPLFHRGGALALARIEICQMNIEIHRPDDTYRRKLYGAMLTLLDDARYVFLEAVKDPHMRLFAFNYGSERCRAKYGIKE